ncbi:J-domain-containing protein [Actinotalea solisilvae]|uniref:DnaJ family domain-containing protein n=1 Tax=Actinotalea solisilvae TaxID=2072922 RepID=UPI0018F12683|nr:DUF1992 domain-containing protein [Actinotalea solisilvae]
MGEDDATRSAARYRVDRLAAEDAAAGVSFSSEDAPEDEAAARPRTQLDGRGRMDRRGAWVDELVQQAIARGEFDDNPFAGKPLPGIDGRHDPDWWLKGLVERERITGVLPEALQLRTDDAALDDRLDRLRGEDQVRRAVEEFNGRVVAARRQLLGGPPVVTPLRDVEAEVRRWAERAEQRRADAAAAAAEADGTDRDAASAGRRRRRWWR